MIRLLAFDFFMARVLHIQTPKDILKGHMFEIFAIKRAPVLADQWK